MHHWGASYFSDLKINLHNFYLHEMHLKCSQNIHIYRRAWWCHTYRQFTVNPLHLTIFPCKLSWPCDKTWRANLQHLPIATVRKWVPDKCRYNCSSIVSHNSYFSCLRQERRNGSVCIEIKIENDVTTRWALNWNESEFEIRYLHI